MIIYFDIVHAIREHDKILEISWWNPGIKEIWNLESALFTLQDDDYYPTFEEKLTKLVFSVNKNHAFNDANKRTSVGLWAYFLEVNGYDYCVDKFICEMENIAVAVADNKISQDLLLEIISSIIYEESYNETLQLKLIDTLL